LPQFEFGVMLLFHTIHRAGSAPLPIALVDRYVNVPVSSTPPMLGLLELSLSGSVRFATLIVQRGAEWTGRESVECTEGSYHLVHALVPFLTFHFLFAPVRSIRAASAASFLSSSLVLSSELAYCFLSQMCEIHVDPASSCWAGDVGGGGALNSSASVQDGVSVLRRRHPS